MTICYFWVGKTFLAEINFLKMFCVNFVGIYQSWNLDWSNAILGGFLGWLLVWVVDYYKKPKIRFGKFRKVKVNFGVLYKIEVKISGHINPGLSAINISADNKNIYAKWDECSNPLESDDLSKFVPEMVPQTFYQNTFSGVKYLVPIIHEDTEQKHTAFSGWWFGRNFGYSESVPSLFNSSEIRLEFLSQNANKKSKTYTLKEIVDSAI